MLNFTGKILIGVIGFFILVQLYHINYHSHCPTNISNAY